VSYKLLENFFFCGIGVTMLLGWLIVLIVTGVFNSDPIAWGIGVGIAISLTAIWAIYTTDEQLIKDKQKAEKNAELWKITLKEKTSGFPSLAEGIAYYEKQQDDYLEYNLRQKSHPARHSADEVRDEARRRREAEFKERITRSINEFYEWTAPFLVDLKNEEFGLDEELLKEYTKEEQEDPVVNYLRKDEYRKLSTTERNQLALDRYWDRWKSKGAIGALYERYIGYLYEIAGYEVEYYGIFQGREDRGRDLIAKKGNEIIVIQCKNWSQYTNIHENMVFQFFGSVYKYRMENPGKNIIGAFITSTTLSDVARAFANDLGIQLQENHPLKRYPCIKCNVSVKDGTKIYHLPFDQQYDVTKINPKFGEFFCMNVQEAEKKGFRRAWRWHPMKED
jgi:hypothetical protein